MKMRKINGDSLTPIAVFNRLTGPRKCLLESSLKTTASGRYSFIGADPSKSFIGEGNSLVEVDYRTGGKAELAGKPLELLKSRMPKYEAQVEGLPFTGGALGYIGYDAIQAYEPVDAPRKNSLQMPDLHLHLYETLVVFDHVKNDVTIISFEDKLDQIEQELSMPEKTIGFDEQQPLQFQSKTDAAKFRAQVEQAKDHIRKGDVFQLVLSQRLSASYKGDAFTLYRKLRKQNPSPYQFFVEFDEYTVVGASPESLLTIRDGGMVTNPIAGTRKRGKTEAEDDMLATELANDEKEQAEHQMLVDLSRNDVGRVAEIGSVAIPKYMAIERYQHVMHLVSEVTGELNRAMHPLDALVSCLPAGTVSGAPKVRAMQLIQQFEEERRGVYGGAIGYFGFNGNLDVALAIRTFVMKDGQVHVQAGAGIVYDSDPQAEYEETLHKARSLTEVFG
ncbi:anthranilate synthase component I [Planomicrobium sp. CPCC 101079]|uniref:anthranilate synthase component I n=1 Tax=Planomicrobium sp. CPCC 101079 TaxID=2599618 RepID=UPI0011B4B7F6|nr:anthranilate synthase component I [Planomicrobium sp. CPCC 101079]TWT02481.1 anthranilate synthase component I [Planomicrobium sp. CPCC 101079]